MNWMAGGFIFRRTDSVYHRFDPRVKLLISLLLFTSALIGKTVWDIGLVVLVMIGISTAAHVLRRVGRTMFLTATFAAFIFIVNLLITRNLTTSTLYAVRFVAIVISTSLFFITTSPDELEQVMKTFHLPRDIVFAFVTAVRFIPVMMLDALQIMDAQKSRGLEMQKGNFLRRIRNMVPVLIPLVVSSVIRSGELAEAMESRAYGAVPRPTSLNVYVLRRADKLVAVASVILFIATAYAFYFVLPA